MKVGRPSANERRGKLTKISFKADADTLAALESLVSSAFATAREWGSATSVRSAVIRKALCAAAETGRPATLPKK